MIAFEEALKKAIVTSLLSQVKVFEEVLRVVIITPLLKVFEYRRYLVEFSSNSQLYKHIRESYKKKTDISAERSSVKSIVILTPTKSTFKVTAALSSISISKSQPSLEYNTSSLRLSETAPSLLAII